MFLVLNLKKKHFNVLMAQWLKSIDLVQRSTAILRYSGFIVWTGWTHAM